MYPPKKSRGHSSYKDARLRTEVQSPGDWKKTHFFSIALAFLFKPAVKRSVGSWVTPHTKTPFLLRARYVFTCCTELQGGPLAQNYAEQSTRVGKIPSNSLPVSDHGITTREQ